MTETIIDEKLLTQFTAIVGEANVVSPTQDQTHYTHENRDIYIGKTPLVLKPASTGEVAAIVKLAYMSGTKLVPQGGHTGHAAGGVPSAVGDELVVSLERMNAIRDVDLAGDTLTVEAGVILENAHKIADQNNRLFPLTIGSKGSCMIGGNISTNAGGTAVLAYGNMRDLVLGLEVVLPNGDIWNGLRRLRKDNTGYDLKHLFMGAEGTLGIITAAVLKLFPKPVAREMAFAGLDNPDQALALFQVARSVAGNSLTTFEIIPRIGFEFVFEFSKVTRDPLDEPHPWYAMVEISSNRSHADAKDIMEQAMTAGFEAGHVGDVVIAQSLSQQDDFWSIRDILPLSQKYHGASIKNDISVPVHLVPELYRRADEIIYREIPDARILAFGHLGDGNIHYNITCPVEDTDEEFLSHRMRINDLINELVISLGGSISAEHGIGLLKRDTLAKTKDPVELGLMKQIKSMLDPKGIMNPGKVL